RGRVPAARRGAHPDLDEPVLAPVRRVSASVLRVAAEPTQVLASSDSGGSRHQGAWHRLPPVLVSGPLGRAEGGGILARLRHRPPARPGAIEPPDVVEDRAAAGDATFGRGEARHADLLARDRVGRHQMTNGSLATRLRELMRHTAVYGLGPVLGQLAAFLLLPLYTNLLSPEDYGRLEIIVLVGNFLNVFFGFQSVTQLLRFYHACESERDRRKAVATAIIFTGILTVVAILPADALRHRLSLALFGSAAYAPLLRLAFWSMASSNVLAASLAYLRARKMSRAFTTISVAQLVGTLSLNLFFVAWLAYGVEGILLSQLLVTGSFALGLAAWVFRQTGIALSLARARDMLAFGLPMIGWSLAVFAVNVADRVVLSGVGSFSDVGVYSLANRFAMTLLVFVITPFSCFWAAERFAVAKQPDGRAVIARVFTYFFVVLCF